MRKILLSISVLLSSAYAEEELYNSLNHSNYEPSYLSMFFGLIIVICLIYITGILYKRLTNITFNNQSEGRYAIKVLSRTSLGPNKNLYVIKINSNLSLVSSARDEIRYLKDLGDDYRD